MNDAPGVTLSKWRKQFPGGRVPPDLALEGARADRSVELKQ